MNDMGISISLVFAWFILVALYAIGVSKAMNLAWRLSASLIALPMCIFLILALDAPRAILDLAEYGLHFAISGGAMLSIVVIWAIIQPWIIWYAWKPKGKV